MLKIHQSIIQLVSDEKTRITKDTASQILQGFAQMVAICAKQGTEMEVLRTKLEERERVYSYADVLRGRAGAEASGQRESRGAGGTTGTAAVPLAAVPGDSRPQGDTATALPSRPKRALLIYLRTPTANASSDIKVILKRYFNPQTLGLTDVSLKENREGIAAQSDSAQELETLLQAIEEHPSTKDIFVLRKPTKRNPQFRVSGVDPDILPAELLTTINNQNEGLDIAPEDFTHRTTFKEKSGNMTHIFEVRAAVYPKIKERNKLHLGWTSCIINKNIYVPRCSKCASYGHTVAKCSSRLVFCTICAGNHPPTECQIKRYEDGKCRACSNRKINDNHPFGASACGTLAFHVARLQSLTDYPQ
uniref:Putative reverse transcriptase sr3-right n=1 Tax=Ixodes ricinus TaxID=34613 RepID=A0A6B0VB35_IXORI